VNKRVFSAKIVGSSEKITNLPGLNYRTEPSESVVKPTLF